MDNDSFFIEFMYRNKAELVEVKPCCEKGSIFYYDISIRNKYQFTVTPSRNNRDNAWKISLKNADKQVDPQFIKLLGEEIEKHLLYK